MEETEVTERSLGVVGKGRMGGGGGGGRPAVSRARDFSTGTLLMRHLSSCLLFGDIISLLQFENADLAFIVWRDPYRFQTTVKKSVLCL